MDWIMQNWESVLLAVTSVIAAASAIAALTPTPKDDVFLNTVRRIIDVLALNIGNAKKK